MQTQKDFIRAEYLGEEPPDGFEHWRVDCEGLQWFRRIESKTRTEDEGGEFPTIYGTPPSEGWFGKIYGWLRGGGR